MNQADIKETALFAARMRKNIIEAVYAAQSGHPGGSLSSADLLALLYLKIMKIDPKNPADPARDRFVLSKGHCTPALYAALAQRGFFPEADLKGFRSIDSYLQGHPSMRQVPGVDMSTGSLGQGISAAVGMALAGKIDQANYCVFALLGDGELQEGQVWEAFMAAAHYKLDNICAFIDHNGLQIDGAIAKVMSPESVTAKLKAFNWNVIECDGHDIDQLEAAVSAARAHRGSPSVVVMSTHKGQGVSFMEDQAGWHGSAPKTEQYEQAMVELNAAIAALEV